MLTGATLEKVVVTHPRTARFNGDPEVLASRLTGRTVRTVGRRGKFLLLPLDQGLHMVAHLGMSGRFLIDPAEDLPHTHFRANLDTGSQVTFVDPRTFGFIGVFDEEEYDASAVGRLGPDAWESPPGVDELARSLAGRTAPIKALLLDQRPISGLGNIYADEALFLAGIDPRSEGGSLTEGQLQALLDAIRVVLERALENGGTSLDDLAYLLPDGRAGENLSQLKVYGRDGEPCLHCGEIIDRVVIRARSSHFCPHCQVRP